MTRGLFKDQQQPKRTKQRKVNKISVPIDKETLMEALITLVAVHNLPLQAVEWKGLKMLLDPICTALNIKINRKSLTKHVNDMASILKRQLADELRNKLICVQIDSASKHGRHILGITVGFFNGEAVIIRTLGKLTLLGNAQNFHVKHYGPHTSPNMFEQH